MCVPRHIVEGYLAVLPHNPLDEEPVSPNGKSSSDEEVSIRGNSTSAEPDDRNAGLTDKQIAARDESEYARLPGFLGDMSETLVISVTAIATATVILAVVLSPLIFLTFLSHVSRISLMTLSLSDLISLISLRSSSARSKATGTGS